MGDKDVEGEGKVTANVPSDERLFMKWVEGQPPELQAHLCQAKLEELLKHAAQPRHASGNACIKLCYFVEQCRGSKVALIRDIAFAESTCFSLFNFFIEWNEKNQNRSMRQVLELVASLLAKNPVEKTALVIKDSILRRVLSIISNEESQPLVKPAFKALECLLGKGAITTLELMAKYRSALKLAERGMSLERMTAFESWDLIIAEIFNWMPLPDVSPAAGKLLVTLFRGLKSEPGSAMGPGMSQSSSWQRWIRVGLSYHPEALENVKNHIFPPLFKLDRLASLEFLEDLNSGDSSGSLQKDELDSQALLRLAALEIGKKSGLVEDPCNISLLLSSKKSAKAILLQDDAFDKLLCHSNDAVRPLAFSVLVSSLSPTRPLSPVALDIIRSNLYVLHSDTDAKVRNEVLSASKHMVERLRGASALLYRELENLKHRVRYRNGLDGSQQELAEELLAEHTRILLQQHADFVHWYWRFLLDELIPTASYQRHITALKALLSLLSSGILESSTETKKVHQPMNEASWSFSINFFRPRTVSILFDLLLDPFDDVRGATSSLLKLAPAKAFSGQGESTHLSSRLSSSSIEVCAKDIISVEQPTGRNLLHFDDIRTPPPLTLLVDFLSHSEGLSNKTGRADYADATAQAYQLLYCLQPSATAQSDLLVKLVDALESRITIAEQDLPRAVQDIPIHGSFIALNLVWQSVHHKEFTSALDSTQPNHQTPPPSSPGSFTSFDFYNNIQSRIIDLSYRIWAVVKPILCNDSPEGHLPEDLDEIEVIDTKDVLSYSFRAIHEASNLLRTILVATDFKRSDESPVLPADEFARIGILSFQQLQDLRHRGAFSTVALTFAVCCRIAGRHNTSSSLSADLLERWRLGALASIDTQASITRRSAGIPVLLTAILAASTMATISKTMKSLLDAAQLQVNTSNLGQLPQVHAINCLRDMCRSASMGPRMDDFVPALVNVVGASLSNQVWAVRNSGLMLLRSIVDLLVGTSEQPDKQNVRKPSTSKIDYNRYPQLADVLLTLLAGAEPALLLAAISILKTAGPPKQHTSYTEIEKLLWSLLGHRVHDVRENAAYTLAAFSIDWPLEQIVLEVQVRLGGHQNKEHGLLLYLRIVIQKRLENSIGGCSQQQCQQIYENMVKTANIFNESSQQRAKHVVMVAFYKATTITARDMRNTHATLCMKQILNKYTETPFDELRRQTPTRPSQKDLQIFRNADYLNLVHHCVFRALYSDASSCVEILDWLAATRKEKAVEAALETVNLVLELTPGREMWDFSRNVDLNDPKYITKLFDTFQICATNFSGLRLRNLAHEVAGRLAVQLLTGGERAYEFARSSLDSLTSINAPLSSSGPEELKSWILFSGSAVFIRVSSFARGLTTMTDEQKGALVSWGQLLVTVSHDELNQDFRFAAAMAIARFTNHLFEYHGSAIGRTVWTSSISQPNLLPYYDALNNLLIDDDEVIRNLAVSSINMLKDESCSPVFASPEFILWQTSMFYKNPTYAKMVVARLLGLQTSKLDKLKHQELNFLAKEVKEALQNDFSLFVKEENNLFLDNVREFRYWSKAFGSIQLSMVDEWKLWQNDAKLGPWSIFLRATAMGLSELTLKINTHAGNRSSRLITARPRGFAITARVMGCYFLCSSFLEKHHKMMKSPTKNEAIQVWQRDNAVAVVLLRETALDTYDHVMNLAPHLVSQLSFDKDSNMEAAWMDGFRELSEGPAIEVTSEEEATRSEALTLSTELPTKGLIEGGVITREDSKINLISNTENQGGELRQNDAKETS